ncbi:lytic transglycosylase [Alpinimonas psychrophila]|uniref:LysM repeat protein n=1 Tax=Alpinimonas psychrophila TaxID=748908 RepID=A0A7W3PND6_9MICO|nr:LysM peptidoglycan-binding domain-containing protein [Alpinimonas psychrophila]MBA8828347.1 LysM repeat protein [Alpinimonas psychrophila]
MDGRRFRSNHANMVTPSLTARVRKNPRASLVVPVALTAIVGVVLGVHSAPGAHAADTPRGDRVLKSKPVDPSVLHQVPREVSPNIRGGKYTVVEGDTVAQIAAAAGISTAELLAANGLSWKTLIFTSQQLLIPRSTSGSSVPTMAPAITRHRVDAGDTLEMIGRTYGVQPRALMTANGLDRSSRLIVGQRLVVPDSHVMGELPAESVA